MYINVYFFDLVKIQLTSCLWLENISPLPHLVGGLYMTQT